jgi:hypothetical protein
MYEILSRKVSESLLSCAVVVILTSFVKIKILLTSTTVNKRRMVIVVTNLATVPPATYSPGLI